ncbi:hypothetical protein ACJX0J_034317, partial [Zea mays]
ALFRCNKTQDFYLDKTYITLSEDTCRRSWLDPEIKGFTISELTILIILFTKFDLLGNQITFLSDTDNTIVVFSLATGCIIAAPHDEFEDASLDYDPFGASETISTCYDYVLTTEQERDLFLQNFQKNLGKVTFAVSTYLLLIWIALLVLLSCQCYILGSIYCNLKLEKMFVFVFFFIFCFHYSMNSCSLLILLYPSFLNMSISGGIDWITPIIHKNLLLCVPVGPVAHSACQILSLKVFG